MDTIRVDYDARLSTNIIAGAEMMHTYGYEWNYDANENAFHLDVGSKELVFIMVYYLYTYDPTDDYDIVSVNTTLITKHQEKKVETHQLMKRLSYPYVKGL